jgi:hypothetical protein
MLKIVMTSTTQYLRRNFKTWVSDFNNHDSRFEIQNIGLKPANLVIINKRIRPHKVKLNIQTR